MSSCGFTYKYILFMVIPIFNCCIILITTKMPKIISIESCIGAGKSTLLERIQQRGYTVVYEPLNQWENWYGKNPLKEMYTDCSKMLHFQLLALSTRATIIKDLLKNTSNSHKDDIIFVERLAGISEEIFMQIALQDGKTTEAEIRTLQLTASLVHLPKADRIVYLNTDLKEITKRVKKRSRESETTMCDDLNLRLKIIHDKQLISSTCIIMFNNEELDIDRMIQDIKI